MMNNEKTQHLGLTDVLSGEIIYIRLPIFKELSFIQALWADPETMASVGGPHRFPEEKAEKWFAHMVDPGNLKTCYCLIYRQDNIPVGEVSFHCWNPQERSATLNIKILASHRGHGYGTDALRTFLAWYFDQAGGRTIKDDVALDNHDGQQRLRSLGFEQDMEFSDVCMLVMTKQMYASKYEKLTRNLKPIPLNAGDKVKAQGRAAEL